MNRVGLGIDSHAFDEGRPLVLGGVVIPGSPGLRGHSDADVLSHAIVDALLGAANLGDLGHHFPATDRWKGVSSLEILREATRLLRDAAWSIMNVDATLIAERPKLSTYEDEMRANLADAMDIDVAACSVKATTSDGLGFTGRGEGIAAMAVILVERPS